MTVQYRNYLQSYKCLRTLSIHYYPFVNEDRLICLTTSNNINVFAPKQSCTNYGSVAICSNPRTSGIGIHEQCKGGTMHINKEEPLPYPTLPSEQPPPHPTLPSEQPPPCPALKTCFQIRRIRSEKIYHKKHCLLQFLFSFSFYFFAIDVR